MTRRERIFCNDRVEGSMFSIVPGPHRMFGGLCLSGTGLGRKASGDHSEFALPRNGGR
jgi:hypothetical protein